MPLTRVVLSKRFAGISGSILAIIGSVIAVEGGYVNNPLDPGGETNFGITKQTAERNNYFDELINIPEDVVYSIYIDDYVIKPKFDKVLSLSPAVGEKLIDAGVNVGIRRSSLWFQKSINTVSRGCTDYPCIVEDGFIGSATLEAYRALQAKRGNKIACNITLKLIDGQQTNHYMSLKHLNTFTVGWITNRIGNISYSKCNDE